MTINELFFKAKIVNLILSKETEEALNLLSIHYEIEKPKLRIGMPKRHSKNPACYVAKNSTIHFSRREVLWSPKIVLHEFYHHLRRVTNGQKGIEKYADKFAYKYIESYQKAKNQK